MYRFWLLAQIVQNFNLNLSSETMLLSACASFAPSKPIGFGSDGGGGGGGGTSAAACCRALNRGSADMAKCYVLMTRNEPLVGGCDELQILHNRLVDVRKARCKIEGLGLHELRIFSVY